MTEYFTVIVHRAGKFRVAIVPIRSAGAFSGASWAEQDGRIFEVDTVAAARAYVGQLSDRHWSCDTVLHGFEVVDEIAPFDTANFDQMLHMNQRSQKQGKKRR